MFISYYQYFFFLFNYLFSAEWCSIIYLNYSLCIYSLVDKYLCCFQFLVIMNEHTINNHEKA